MFYFFKPYRREKKKNKKTQKLHKFFVAELIASLFINEENERKKEAMSYIVYIRIE